MNPWDWLISLSDRVGRHTTPFKVLPVEDERKDSAFLRRVDQSEPIFLPSETINCEQNNREKQARRCTGLA